MSTRALLSATMAMAMVSFSTHADVLGQSYYSPGQGNPPPTGHSGSLPFPSSQFDGRSHVAPATVLATRQQYAPQQYTPQQYTPQQYAPQQYAPQRYAPLRYAPQQASQQQASQQQATQAPSQTSLRYPVIASSQLPAKTLSRLPPVPNVQVQPHGVPQHAGHQGPGSTSFQSASCTNCQPAPTSWTLSSSLASQGFWYAGGRALYMTRDRGDNVWLSLDTDNLPAHLLDTHDASMDWELGLEGYFGRAFDCGRSALEGRYWGVSSDVQEASVLQTAAAGNFDTPINFTPLVFDNGGGGGPEPVANFFLNAEIHRVQRSFEAHNVEINFMRLLGGCEPCMPACGASCGGGSCGCGECGSFDCGESVGSPLQVRWVAGLRYFRFDEGFQFATDRGSIVFGDDPAEELYYEIDVANHLIGFQLGGRFDYASCGRWSVHGDTKLGVYGNHITHHQFLGGGNGAAIIDDVGGPFNTSPYDISSSKNDASMIAEFDFGCDIAISRCWSAGFGCRLVGATGIALTTAQIPRYFEDLGDARRIDSTGSLLLHGGYAQIEFVR